MAPDAGSRGQDLVFKWRTDFCEGHPLVNGTTERIQPHEEQGLLLGGNVSAGAVCTMNNAYAYQASTLASIEFQDADFSQEQGTCVILGNSEGDLRTPGPDILPLPCTAVTDQMHVMNNDMFSASNIRIINFCLATARHASSSELLTKLACGSDVSEAKAAEPTNSC